MKHPLFIAGQLETKIKELDRIADLSGSEHLSSVVGRVAELVAELKTAAAHYEIDCTLRDCQDSIDAANLRRHGIESCERVGRSE